MSYLQEAEVECPYCGEFFPLEIDTSEGDHETITDCSVCCRPMTLTVRCEPGLIDSVESAT